MRSMDFFGDYYRYRDNLDDEMDDEVDNTDSVNIRQEREYTPRQTHRRHNYSNRSPRERQNYERYSNEFVDMRRETPRRYPQDSEYVTHMSRRDHRRVRNIDRLYGDDRFNRYNSKPRMNYGSHDDDDRYDRRYRDTRRQNRYRGKYTDRNYHDNTKHLRVSFIKGNHEQIQRSDSSRAQFKKSDMNTAIKLLGLILLVLMIIFAIKGDSAYAGVTGVVVILFIGYYLTSKGKRSNKGR